MIVSDNNRDVSDSTIFKRVNVYKLSVYFQGNIFTKPLGVSFRALFLFTLLEINI